MQTMADPRAVAKMTHPRILRAFSSLQGKASILRTAFTRSNSRLPPMKSPAALLLVASILLSSLHAAVDGEKIEQLTGLKGTLNESEGVFKVSLPRTDVKVSVDGWQMPPFMGLTSWAAFTDGKGAEAMVMGDIVLLQDEVNPAMSAALDAGLEVTALHNHFFYDEPKVYFMHIGGEGETAKLASAIKAVLDAQKAVRTAAPEPPFARPSEH